MADDRLRLVAEVTDQFTGPLGKLETALRRAGATGTQAGKDLKRDFDGFHGALGKTTTALQGIQPILSGLGVAGLTAGVSLGAVTAALGGFSKGTQQLAIMSKETGLAIDQLRAFGALGERFGVSAETMQGGVRKFADEMSQMRKRYGQVYMDLQQMNLGEMVEKMIASPNVKTALDTFMESVTKIGDPVKRRKVVEMVLGSDQIAAVAGQLIGRYRQVMDEILKAQGTTTDAQVKAAQRFEDALSRVRENMDGLRTQALAPLLQELSRLVEKFSSADAIAAFSKQLEEIGKFARTTVQEFEAIVRTYEKFKEFIGLGDPSKNKEFQPLLGGPTGAKALEGRKFSLEQQRDLLDKNPGAPDYQRKRDRMTEELKRVGDELEKLRTTGGATAQPSGFSGVTGGGNPLIQRASYGSGGGSGGGFGGVGSIPPLGLPGPLANRGSGGTAISPHAPIPTLGLGGSSGVGAANPDAMKALGNAIAGTESGKAGYDAVLGNGRYGTPDKPVSQMTVDEAYAFGRSVRARHGSSSALGRYQIVGQTMRAAQRALGLPGDAPFNANTQDQMMRWIARRQGLGAWEGLKGNPRAMAAARAAMAAGGANDAAPGTSAAEADVPYYRRSRSGVPGQMSRLRDDEIEVPGGGRRAGDELMGRAFGRESAAPPPQTHRMTIDLNGFPAGTRARTSMGDLFKETTVSKSRQVEAI